MAYTTVNKSTDYQNTKLYTGNASTNAITGVGFQPDWVWTKDRDATYDHMSWDAVRGATKRIKPNETTAENTQSDGLTSFDSDGFTMGADNGNNASGDDFVSWNWKANGAGSANTDGSISSTVSVNTTAGFSMVKFVGNATSGASVGHGLGVAPSMVIIKSRDSGLDWRTYHVSIGAGKYVVLNQNTAEASNTNFMNDTSPTSDVFYLGNGTTPNKSGDNYIAYCFAEIKGYSKFGSYTGNGNADGPFIYTGFKPTWMMWKKSSGAENWGIGDSVRNTFNRVDKKLRPDSDIAEVDADIVDFYSNGFKWYSSSGEYNASGATYLYAAFGQTLVGTNNIPGNAR